MTKPKQPKTPSPPPHLRPETREWWNLTCESYGLDEHHVKLLRLAAEAWDRGQQAREILARDGLTYVDRFNQPKVRPEVAVERDSRIAFARMLREIGLDVATEPDDSRPPTIRTCR